MSPFIIILVAVTVTTFVVGYIAGRRGRTRWRKDTESAGLDAYELETRLDLSCDGRTTRIVDRFKAIGFELDIIEDNTLKFTLRPHGFLRRTWGTMDLVFSVLVAGPLIPALLAGADMDSRRVGKDGEQIWYRIEAYRIEDPSRLAIYPAKNRWWKRLW